MMLQGSFAILITVIVSITVGFEQVVYAQLGQTVSLQSQIKSPRIHRLTWYKDNTKIAKTGLLIGSRVFAGKRRFSISNKKLVIWPIQENDFGIFKAITEIFVGDATNETFILCKISVSQQPALLVPGEILSLVCDPDTPAGHKAPEIYWVKPCGTKIDKDGGASGGRLAVRFTSKDHGMWTCVLINNQREHSAKITVRVLTLQTPNYQYTSLSSPLTLPCYISPQVPWEELKSKGFQGVYWHFLPDAFSGFISESPQRLFSLLPDDPPIWKEDQGRGLSPAQKLDGGLFSLDRKQGRADDKGAYECSIAFTSGTTLKRTIHVEILQRDTRYFLALMSQAEVVSSPATNLFIGQTLNLSCSIGRPLPPGLLFKWFPPDRSSLPPLSHDHNPTYVSLPEATRGDSGRWRCELWQDNTYMTSAAITLTIEPRITKQKLVTICTTPVTVIVVILICLVYIRRQKMCRPRRPRRRRYCRCKHPKIKRLMTQQATGS